MTLTIYATMVSHAAVFVDAFGQTRTYPTVEAFLRWLSDTHRRVVEAGGTRHISTPSLNAHPADLALREAIGKSSAGECLA